MQAFADDARVDKVEKENQELRNRLDALNQSRKEGILSRRVRPRRFGDVISASAGL